MKTLIVPAGVLLLSLGAAWLQFTAEPDKIGDNEVLIMANQSTQIEQIDWIATQQEVHISSKSDKHGDYLWVEYIDKKDPEDHQEKYFLAGKNGDKLLDHLSPLVGIRKLDPDVPLNTLGLDEPSAQLSITSNGKTRLFSIGDEAYGTKDVYVRDDSSNELFLVDDSPQSGSLYSRNKKINQCHTHLAGCIVVLDTSELARHQKCTVDLQRNINKRYHSDSNVVVQGTTHFGLQIGSPYGRSFHPHRSIFSYFVLGKWRARNSNLCST